MQDPSIVCMRPISKGCVQFTHDILHVMSIIMLSIPGMRSWYQFMHGLFNMHMNVGTRWEAFILYDVKLHLFLTSLYV